MRWGSGTGYAAYRRMPRPVPPEMEMSYDRPMSPELIAVPAVGVAPGGMVLGGQRLTRVGIAELRRDFGDPRERMARLEGLLEFLRDAVAGRQAAE